MIKLDLKVSPRLFDNFTLLGWFVFILHQYLMSSAIEFILTFILLTNIQDLLTVCLPVLWNNYWTNNMHSSIFCLVRNFNEVELICFSIEMCNNC